MSSTIYLRFTEPMTGRILTTSGQYESAANAVPVTTSIDPNSNQFFKIISYSTDVVNQATVGSATAGAGGGKINFNQLNITRPSDAASGVLFQNCSAGMHYKLVELYVVNQSGALIAKYYFKTVFTTAIAWSGTGEDKLVELITFSYGVFVLSLSQQAADGKIAFGPFGGWNQMKNISETNPTSDAR